MSYPDELAERDHLDDLLGKGPGDPDTQDEKRWVGDKPAVEHRNGDSEIEVVTDDGLSIEEVPF